MNKNNKNCLTKEVIFTTVKGDNPVTHTADVAIKRLSKKLAASFLFENGKESTIAPIIITARKESDTFFGAESRPECFRLVKTISFITKSPIIASILTPRCDKSNTSLSLRHNIE